MLQKKIKGNTLMNVYVGWALWGKKVCRPMVVMTTAFVYQISKHLLEPTSSTVED